MSKCEAETLHVDSISRSLSVDCSPVWIMIVDADCTVQLIYHLIINTLILQGFKFLNPSRPDSSDRSPSKLSGRHW